MIFGGLQTSCAASSATCISAYAEHDYESARAACFSTWNNSVDRQVGNYVAGEMYELGKGVEEDLDKALDYYRRSAENGYPPAMLRLANHYSDIDICISKRYLQEAVSYEWPGREYVRTRLDALEAKAQCDYSAN